MLSHPVCRDDLVASMLPKYRDILRQEAELDILIFSGDVDGSVPVMGTRRWVTSLQLPIVKEWRPWYSHTGNCGTKSMWIDPVTWRVAHRLLLGRTVLLMICHEI